MKFNLDYFYGADKEKYLFYRVPKSLFEDSRFNVITFEARMFYAFLLDRVSLSAGNGWTDARGRVYIFFTLEETMETTGYGHNRATRMFQELENFGLIERRRQGLGRPVKIYVKNLRRDFDGNPVAPETPSAPASSSNAAPAFGMDASGTEVAETSAYGETASEYPAAPEPEQEPAPETESREPEPVRSPARIDGGGERIPTVLAVPAKVLDAITEPEQALQFMREAYEVMMSYSSAQELPDGGVSAGTPVENSPDAVVGNVENVENFSTFVEKSTETRRLAVENFVEIPLFTASVGSETAGDGSGTSGERLSGLTGAGTLDCPKSAPIKNKKNKNYSTENNQSNPPTPSGDWRPSAEKRWQAKMERIRACKEETKETVGYDLLLRENPFDKPLIDGYVNLIVEVMCAEGESFRIGKSQRPLEEIQERFAQLEYEHLSYVLDSMKSNRTRVYNPRAYMLTSLFNAPLTCDAYLTARVNYDMA